MSMIENTLYEGRGAYGITEFALSPRILRLRIKPWEGSNASKLATFRDVRMISVDVRHADTPENLEMPWDIIAFDCHELPLGRWRFVLLSECIEWCFESAWPVIERFETP